MSGGRPRSLSPFTTWKINIDAGLAAEVEMFLWDPIHKKPRYGTRGSLIEALLRHWLATQREGRQEAPLPTTDQPHA